MMDEVSLLRDQELSSGVLLCGKAQGLLKSFGSAWRNNKAKRFFLCFG
jgi:hypothetical protein